MEKAREKMLDLQVLRAAFANVMVKEGAELFQSVSNLLERLSQPNE